MSRVVLRTAGGSLCLPDPATIMIDRRDGGQLVVNPPRRVWERTVLTRDELVAWHLLTAATGRAMLETLPQLDGGCINYWDAGNWALNDAADPPGPKRADARRVLHQHVIGRSPRSTDPDWRWGESPFFPAYLDRFTWSAGKTALTAAECTAIVARARAVLVEPYGVSPDDIQPGTTCTRCGYPVPVADVGADGRCAVCSTVA